jgi:hypothetical protein
LRVAPNAEDFCPRFFILVVDRSFGADGVDGSDFQHRLPNTHCSITFIALKPCRGESREPEENQDYKEGWFVKKGQLLFEIVPVRFRARWIKPMPR